MRSRINNNWCRTFWPRRPLSTAYKTRSWQRPTSPKHPASVVFDSATYLLTISSPDAGLRCLCEWHKPDYCACVIGRIHKLHVFLFALGCVLDYTYYEFEPFHVYTVYAISFTELNFHGLQIFAIFADPGFSRFFTFAPFSHPLPLRTEQPSSDLEHPTIWAMNTISNTNGQTSSSY